jgi:hypothetical protein
VSSGGEPTREPFLKKMFFGSSNRAEREEKVLQYIIHRMSEEAPLHDVIREDYVRRNCTQDEIYAILNAPELVHACREQLWRTFESETLDPGRVSRRSSPTRTNGSPTSYRDDSDPTSPGDEPIPKGEKWTPPRCDHSGPTMVERTEGGYAMRCMTCRRVGPVRRTPEAARKALLVLGARDGWRLEGRV